MEVDNRGEPVQVKYRDDACRIGRLMNLNVIGPGCLEHDPNYGTFVVAHFPAT